VTSRADPVSICLSGACAVHCLAGPVVISVLPVAAPLVDPLTEWVFLALSLAVSGVTLLRGCVRAHRSLLPLCPYVVGACLLLIRGLADKQWLEMTLTVAGASLLMASHAWNMHACQRSAGSPCGRLRQAVGSRMVTSPPIGRPTPSIDGLRQPVEKPSTPRCGDGSVARPHAQTRVGGAAAPGSFLY
jgi:hypothetical protein